eukprot:3507004-Amphidinium_carterae.1
MVGPVELSSGLKRGFDVPIVATEAHSRFWDSLRIAAQGAIDKLDGSVRVVHDGTHVHQPAHSGVIAHRRVLVRPCDWGKLGCKSGAGEHILFHRVGTFGEMGLVLIKLMDEREILWIARIGFAIKLDCFPHVAGLPTSRSAWAMSWARETARADEVWMSAFASGLGRLGIAAGLLE